MTTTLSPVQKADTPAPVGGVAVDQERTILHGISWKTYESLLEDYRDRSAPRFAYDRGVLEIKSPSSVHERSNWAVTRLVEIVCEARGLEYDNLGSTTFKRDDLVRGFEPDSCFYIQNIERVADVEEINLRHDPAPDLVIEIDLTSPSLNKLPLYAQIGVPEIWRLLPGDGMTIFLLEEGTYQETNASAALAPLSREDIENWVAQSRTMRRIEWLRREAGENSSAAATGRAGSALKHGGRRRIPAAGAQGDGAAAGFPGAGLGGAFRAKPAQVAAARQGLIRRDTVLNHGPVGRQHRADAAQDARRQGILCSGSS